MSYATDFINGYIKPLNIKEFTHRDILMHTTTNCPHKVLQKIKELLKEENIFLIDTTIDNRGTKKYQLEKRENQNE